LSTVIGKIFADKNFRDNNIGGKKMPSCPPAEGTLAFSYRQYYFRQFIYPQIF
jgi:hypothetical protein